MVGPLLRLLNTSLLLLVAGALAAGCGFGGGGDLTLGYPGWDENVANSYLTKVLLEDELGYEKVELKLTDNVGTVYKDLIGGKTDAFLDAWMPNHEQFVEGVEAGSRSLRSHGTLTRPGTGSPLQITCITSGPSPIWTPRGPT
jgi:ABC-type proline/glycine betaine transport system substrate-binding protein